MNASKILELVRKKVKGNDTLFVGFRGLYEEPNKLGALKNSHRWTDGEPTEEELGGTCTIGVGIIELGEFATDISEEKIKELMDSAKIYGDGETGLVIGDGCQYGEDQGEWILENARLIKIL